MIAQLVLSALLMGVLFYAWMEYLRSPAVGLLAWAAALVGFYFVWVPAHATQLAALSVSAAASTSLFISGSSSAC